MTTAAPVSIGVGFDTARDGHHVSFLGTDRQPAAQAFTFAESPAGYAELRQALERLQEKSEKFTSPYVSMPPVSTRPTWTLPPHAAVAENHLRRPAQAESRLPQRAFPQTQGRPRGRGGLRPFAIVEQPDPTPETPPVFAQLRDSPARLESQVKQTTRLVNQLHNRLARTFPELAPACARPRRRDWVLAVAGEVPHPRQDRRRPPRPRWWASPPDRGQGPEDPGGRSAHRGQPPRTRRRGVDPPIGPGHPPRSKDHPRVEAACWNRPTTPCPPGHIGRSRPSRASANRPPRPWWPRWSASSGSPRRGRLSATSGSSPKRTPRVWTNSVALCPPAPCP